VIGLPPNSAENRDRPFAGSVDPIDTYALVCIGLFRDLERIGRSAVVKFHGQRIRREDVVGHVTAPLSGDVFICHYMSLRRRQLEAKPQSLQAKQIS